MNFKKLSAALVGLIMAVSFNANAGLISGPQYTDDGKLVALQGLEWMPLDHTAGISRKDIEDGFTDRFGNTWSATDWRYASIAETGLILSSLWDGIYDGWSSGNADGANWFIDNFFGLIHDTGFGVGRVDKKRNDTGYTNWDGTWFVYGKDAECGGGEMSCAGSVEVMENNARDMWADNVLTDVNEISYAINSGSVGLFSNSGGLNFGPNNKMIAGVETSTVSFTGSLLVRNTPLTSIPEPSTLAIFALGIMGLASRRFKKQ